MFAKRKLGNAFLAGGMVAALLGIGQPASAADPFSLSSPAFKDGTMLERKNAGNIKTNPNCVGENISPPFSWSNVPAGTKSLALVMVDPEGRQGLGVIHWVAYGIAPSLNGFSEGELGQLSNKYVGGKGTQGAGHYLGPCTPPGTGMHHYTFTLIATDLAPGELPPGLTRDELLAKLNGHAKGAAGLVGLFGRP
jgi:Raf kinase inhibitor-like YbhB/YbcL family protein